MGNPGRYFLLCLLCNYLQSITSPAEHHLPCTSVLQRGLDGNRCILPLLLMLILMRLAMKERVILYQPVPAGCRSPLPGAAPGSCGPGAAVQPRERPGGCQHRPCPRHSTQHYLHAGLGSSSFSARTYDFLQPLFHLRKAVKFMVVWANYLLQSPALPNRAAETGASFCT